MLYWGVFVFSLKMLFPGYERAVDINLVIVAFFTKDRVLIVYHIIDGISDLYIGHW